MLCNVYKAEYTYMNTRHRMKGGTYINRYYHFSNFGFRTKWSRGFFGKCTEHVVFWYLIQCSQRYCSKRSASSRSSVTMERIDVRVTYRRRAQTRTSLEAAFCGRCSSVRALLCCSRCPLLTPENILAAKISCAIVTLRCASTTKFRRGCLLAASLDC